MYINHAYVEKQRGSSFFMCHVRKVFRDAGYLIKLSKPEETILNLEKLVDKPHDIKFEFQYNDDTKLYQRVVLSHNNELLDSLYVDQGNKNSIYGIIREKLEDEDDHKNSSDNINRNSLFGKDQTLVQMQKDLQSRVLLYSEGIHTYRIINGELVRIRDKGNQAMLESIDEIEANKKLEKEIAQKRNLERIKFLALKNQYKQLIKVQPTSGSIRNLGVVTTIFLLIFIGMSFLTYYIVENSMNVMNTMLNIPWKQSIYNYYAYEGLFNANSLALMKSSQLNSEIVATYIPMLRTDIHNAANMILATLMEMNDLLNDYVDVADIYITDSDVNLILYTYTETIYLVVHTYTESLHLMTNCLLEIASQHINDYFNPNLMFLHINLLESFRNKELKMRNIVLEKLDETTLTRKSLCIIIMIASMYLYFIASVLVFPFLLNANKSLEEIISFFLKMPTEAIIQLQTRCESYLAHKTEDSQFENTTPIVMDSNSENDDEDGSMKGSEGRKEFLKITNSKRAYLLDIFLIMIILDSFSILVTIFMSYVANVTRLNIRIIDSMSRMAISPMLVSVSLMNYIMDNKNGINTKTRYIEIENIDKEIVYYEETHWELFDIIDVVEEMTREVEEVLMVLYFVIIGKCRK